MFRWILFFLACLVVTINPSWAVDDQERRAIEAVDQAQLEHGPGTPEHLHALARLIVYYDYAGRGEDALEPARRYVRLLESATTFNASSDLDKFQRDLVRRLLRLGRVEESKREEQRMLARMQSVNGNGTENPIEMKIRLEWQALPLAPLDVPHEASNTERELIQAVNDAARRFGAFGRYRLPTLAAYMSFLEREHADPKRLLAVAHRALEIAGLLNDGASDESGLVAGTAELHMQVSEYVEALILYRHAVQYLVASRGEEAEETLRGYHNLAFVLDRLGRHEEALPIYEHAAELATSALGLRHSLVAVIKSSWAESLAQSGRTDQAASVAHESLEAIRSIPSPKREDLVRCLTSARIVFATAGLSADAVAISRELVVLQRGDSAAEDGRQLNDLAVTLSDAGRYKEALDAALRSLELLGKEYGDDALIVATPLNTLAMIYASLGKPDEALPYIQRSAELTEARLGPAHIEAAKKRINEVLILSNLNRDKEAIEVMERIAPVIETQPIQDISTRATYYHNYAALEAGYAFRLNSGSTSEQRATSAVGLPIWEHLTRARDHAERAVALRSATYPDSNPSRQQSEALLATLRMMSGTDSPSDAATPLIKLLALGAGNDVDTTTQHFLQMSLALAYAAQGKANAAIIWGKHAVNTLRDESAQNVDLPTELRSSLAEKGRFTFEVLAALLVRQGRISEAQQVFRMLKEYELGEIVRGALNTGNERAELTGLEKSKFGDFYRFRDQMAAMASERMELEQRRNPTEAERARLSEIVAAQKSQVDAIVALLKRLDTDMASAPVGQNNADAALEAGQLQRIVDRLAIAEPNAHAVGLQYLVSDDTLTILLTMPNAPPIAHQVKIERAALYRQINRVLIQLSEPDADANYYSATLKAMYELLISPVAAELKQLGARTLMLSLDDQLRLLPFAALMGADGQYLIHKYTLALYNEAAGQTLDTASAAHWRVAAMGLSKAPDGKQPLRAVPEELKSIVGSPGISGKVFLDDNFTRERLQLVLKDEQPGFNVLHVASHFDFRPGEAQDSVLYLGKGERVSLADLTMPAFDFSHFDLVTYSACQSGIANQRQSSGQELEGLGAITQRQGAQAVLATLWSVADESTNRLMQHYYSARQHLNKAEALRKAQLTMIESTQDAAPFRWAPFVLMGNWR